MRIAVIGAVLALTGAPVHAARSDVARDARKGIQAGYDQFNAAYMKKDFGAVQHLFASGCVLSMADEHRSMSALRAVQGMKSMSRSLTVTHARTRIVSFAAASNGYEVVAEWAADSNYRPPTGGTSEDPARKAKVKQTYKDLWRKTDKGWQVAHRDIEN